MYFYQMSNTVLAVFKYPIHLSFQAEVFSLQHSAFAMQREDLFI